MNRPIRRIAFITSTLKTGGSEKIILFLSKKMRKMGFETQLIVIGQKNPINQSIDGIDITFLNKRKFRHSIFKLFKVLKKVKADIIFSSVVHLNIFLGLYKIFYPKTKCIIRISSIISQSEKKSNSNLFLKQLKFFFIKKVDFLIFQSSEMKIDFMSVFPKANLPTRIINNPIITPMLNLRQKTYEDFNLRFITVGSLTALKGHKRILNSLNFLNKNFTYDIYGQGDQKSTLEKMVTNLRMETKVNFKGEIPFSHHLIKSPNTFYLLGSYFEGFPNAVLEALSFGVPVIAFQSPGGHNEIIISGFNGFFAKSKKEFSEIILKSIMYNWNKNDIIQNIYYRFDSQKILLQYKDLFQKI